MATGFQYTFPSIRGVQAGREYFVTMCPLRLIPRIFLFDEEELVPELRAQRTLNKGRIPEMSRYLVENPEEYVFSAITASLDADVRFEALGESGEENRVGKLHIPMEARFIINDGQHRRAAIQRALAECPELGDETIAVVFFLDVGLERCQQMFADLNRYAVRPTKSLSVLYDHRDDLAILSRLVAWTSTAFKGLVEMERSSLSARSSKLFTLSAIHSANQALLGKTIQGLDSETELAVSYWDAVGEQFPHWQQVRQGELKPSEVRRDFIHSHAVVLHALGKVGKALTQLPPSRWMKRLQGLRKIDWLRSNAALWEGRAMIGGRISKTERNVTLTANAIKRRLRLKLLPEEKQAEVNFRKGNNGQN